MSKITIDRSVLEQALDALISATPVKAKDPQMQADAIVTLREALAQPQQEPVAWVELLREARDNCRASIVEEGISAGRKEYRIDLEARLTAAVNGPPPERKPLTDEQIDAVWHKDLWRMQKPHHAFARAIEAAHGIKEAK